MSGAIGVVLAGATEFVSSDKGRWLLFAASLLALFLSFYRAWAAERNNSISLYEELSRLKDTGAELSPRFIADLPIKELFSYIDADVLEFGRANEIGQFILDRLSLGEITAYGKRARFGVGLYEGEPTLVPIPRQFWESALFTYDFFGEDRENDIHAMLMGDNALCYRGIRFTSSEVALYWKKSKSSGQISAVKAIYLALSQSEWAKRHADSWQSLRPLSSEDGKDPKKIRMDRVAAVFKVEVHNQLRAGKLHAVGIKNRKQPLEQIPADEWSRIHILMDEMALQNSDWSCAGLIHPSSNTSRETIYMDVRFEKDEFFNAYPLLAEPYEK